MRCPIGEGLKIDGEVNATPQEQLQHEVDYVRAQQILTTMLDCGLISLSEFNKITDLNRKTFSPLLAEIMA
ncbi:MAG: SHOCT domain-containing protein [Eubacteriales bacterium]